MRRASLVAICFCVLVGFYGLLSRVDASGVSQITVIVTSGAGAPVGNCTAPGPASYSAYIDTTNQNEWICTATNTWKTAVQVNLSNAYSSGTTQDFSLASHLLPRTGLTAAITAGNCTTGEIAFATDATAGRNWYFCTATNTWTQQVAGSSGTVTSVGLVGTANQITITGASPITTSGSWTVSIPTSPSFTTPNITTSATLSNNGIGSTSSDGYVLQNTTAAAAGAQQWSPRLHLIGQGWKTNATAASQQTEWLIENETAQDAVAPQNALVFTPVKNGSTGFKIYLCQAPSGTIGSGIFGLDSNVSGNAGCDTSNAPSFNGFGSVGAGNVFGTFVNGAEIHNFNSHGIGFGSTVQLMWFSGAAGNAQSGDTGVGRGAAAVVDINDGSNTTCTGGASHCGFLTGAGFYDRGTTFTASGCTSTSSLTGGSTAGTLVIGAANCSLTITMGNSATAPHGWICSVDDRTTIAALLSQSSDSATTCVISIPATAMANDVIQFSAIGY